ncbi:hypothetical protein LCGC14_0830680 [marine sediment metagenome]|uniref:Uncharacterized protein n=1 Tax=marine sediment metagenome TaxID=412755 RepID=A0A0F9SN98_9ZZZZ
MAAGDIFADQQDIANTAFLTVRPVAGKEAVVHNLFYGASVEVYRVTGALVTEVVAATGALGNTPGTFHVDSTYYIKVKNVSGSNAELGFDGVYTK